MRTPPLHRQLILAMFALLPALPLAAAESATPSAAQSLPQLQAQTPRVEAEMLDGSPTSVAAHRGEIVVLSVWSPESLSSRKCIWELQRFASAYASREIFTLAASTLNDKDVLRDFIAKRKLDLPVAMLGKHDLGRIDDPRLPLVYVFDRNGQLKATHAGLFSMQVLEQLVAPLIQ